VALRIDVSKEEDTQRMAADAVRAFGRIDILVNNAAIFINIQRHPFYEITAEEWDRVSAVNIKGPFLCAKAVFSQMKEQQYGKIINISSSTAYWGTPMFLHYVASKAALVGMTRSLAREVGEFGICVNAIAPGLVEHEGQNAPQALTELQLKARSIKRLETPEDLLGVLVYLASPDSDFVTGQTLVVDGGSVFH
jgi:NAD(P)-dependent dehydrogenase (short-subunit alcohol dehydrogenase family)